MQLTRLTDYSFRILIYLAANRGRQVTVREIAANYSISRSQMMKVANILTQRGFVRAVRGRGGGLTLARPPSQINMGDVARKLEEDFDVVECFTGSGRCRIEPGCRLKPLLGRAVDAFLHELDSATLADIAGEPGAIVHLLNRPQQAAVQRGAG